MESARARQLTTRLVAGGLLCGLACFALGFALTLRSELPADARSVPLRELPEALAALDPSAWLSLGALWLILTPSLRLAGLSLTFAAEQEPGARRSALLVLLLLLGSLLVA